jgi:3,4-dihydroxy 2-butanone 4-phosphate synthase/GTP cyclohydrolase II
MQLSDWLEKHRVKRKDFAARIQMSPSYITAICNGTVWPGRDVAVRILTETGGAVKPNDFLKTRETTA